MLHVICVHVFIHNIAQITWKVRASRIRIKAFHTSLEERFVVEQRITDREGK